MKKLSKLVVTVGAALTAVSMLVACGNASSEATSKTVKIAYQQVGDNTSFDKWIKNVKKEFEEANKGATLELVPVQSQGDDYGNKLSLMNRADSTAPDLMFLDSSNLRPYIESKYIEPLDTYLTNWDQWGHYFDNVKEVGKGDDGKTYGVSLGTDTRGLWYRKDILATVGITGDWQPKSWADLLDVARQIKEKNPDVMPFNIYTGKAQGEAGVMQGFEMLLYGTPDGTLYDPSAKKWIAGSKQFEDSLGFINTVFSEKLGPSAQQASDPQLGNKVPGEWLKQGKLAMTIDGNWLSSTWQTGGDYEWTEWQDKIGWTGFPTQNGQATMTSMSGGWVVAMSSKSKNKDLTFKALETLQSKENAKAYYIGMGQIAVRDDIQNDEDYLKTGPTTEFFTKAAQFTHYRPMTSDYNQVSSLISVATESVMTAQKTPKQALADYDAALKTELGADKVTTK